MRVLGLDKRDLKLFAVLLAFANLPPIMVHSGIPPLMIFGFLPALFWVNVPGMPLAIIIGQPHFDIQEFGAMPKDTFSWTLIIIFWILVPYGATLIMRKLRKRTNGVEEQPPAPLP